MKLLLKLLKRNLNVWQVVGFVFANLIGAIIVLMGYKAYQDINDLTENDEGVLSSGFIVLSKPVNGMTTITSAVGIDNYFSKSEIEELEKLPSVKGVGCFKAANFEVDAKIDWKGLRLSTDVFLESVPNEYIDVDINNIPNVDGWAADVNDENCIVPVIIPKSYVALYNFGYASSRGLPQISENVLTNFPITLILKGNGEVREYKAQICGYSARINTVLVPEQFIDDANAVFAPDVEPTPKRLIVAVDAKKESDELLEYAGSKKYTIEGGDVVRVQTFVNVVLIVVIAIGALVSLLAFSLLLISILLLIEKNKEKFINLHSIGYSVEQIAAPYQMLTLVVDVVVWVIALLVAMALYSSFESMLIIISPEFVANSSLYMLVPALVLCLLFVIMHRYMIKRQIKRICK